VNVVEERRHSSVRLKIDDRDFSRCLWQRTRWSLGYLTVTQSLSVCRCLDQPDKLTHVVGQPSEVRFPYSDVRVRVNWLPGSSSRCRLGRDAALSSTFKSAVHWQVPAVVDVA